ncbi:DUF4249 domain-containing protein [uncultured Pontibacter sp.]|uniref:DUF4249 domain-containing protein n=1 Tax=uncultured Pontibacter sp. TaxID=453356 RepID=UPI0026157593|nr:DUF4249 domain-containing protein [uncultured Pontibacter sp.]
MKTSIWLAILSFAALFTLTQCVEPFELPASAIDANILVVEGSLNIEKGTGKVVLSRSQKLEDQGEPIRETRAKVTIETDANESFSMYDVGGGAYRVTGMSFSYGKQYRLRVKTANGEEYVSEFVSTQKTPEIDDITWRAEQNGIQISVSSHDPANNTLYYRWEFEETYEYTSYYNSLWAYKGGEVIPRSQEEQFYKCWRTDPSTSILVGSTAHLVQDVVRDYPLVFREGVSEKLATKYSILVRQYGISKAEYEYWQMLKKNTESVGSIFDAQPSQVRGNIKNVKQPDNPVLGYFSIQSMTEKRMFISGPEMRKLGFSYHDIPVCSLDTTSLRDLPQWLAIDKLIVEELLPPNAGYVVANRACADCRVKGGSTIKPEYWK